ncbi:hypothetical protein [Litoreibacter halocynthiae]|nr:hypothetical protein [Litoreibacter halocynthiae]
MGIASVGLIKHGMANPMAGAVITGGDGSEHDVPNLIDYVAKA